MTTLRRDELDRMTKPALCTLYRSMGYIGGMHPPETWLKEEVVNSILSIQDEKIAGAGCDTCRQPGTWCGSGGVMSTRRPCVCCGDPTYIRSRCGGARTAECAGPAPAPAPESAPARKPRETRPARPSRTQGRTAEQAAETDAAIARLTAGEPLRFLAALEGPFAPLRTVPGTTRKSLPFWQPPLPPITFATRVVTGYQWQRPYTGRVAVLDRSGAWVAAVSSALVAHSGLEHTGPCEFTNRPGYYLIAVYPWYETDRMPSPLGHLRPGETAWVMAPTVQLLARLVDQGRWPDVAILDSYTGDGVRLNDWATHMNAVRKFAIGTWGRQSPQYGEVKTSIGEAMSLLLGKPDGVRRMFRSKAHRPDYTHTWQAQSSATLWGWGDDCGQVVPELAPVALRNTDELVVPEAAVTVLTTRPRSGGRKPMVIDPAGVVLGSFKVKDIEEWAA